MSATGGDGVVPTDINGGGPSQGGQQTSSSPPFISESTPISSSSQSIDTSPTLASPSTSTSPPPFPSITGTNTGGSNPTNGNGDGPSSTKDPGDGGSDNSSTDNGNGNGGGNTSHHTSSSRTATTTSQQHQQEPTTTSATRTSSSTRWVTTSRTNTIPTQQQPPPQEQPTTTNVDPTINQGQDQNQENTQWQQQTTTTNQSQQDDGSTTSLDPFLPITGTATTSRGLNGFTQSTPLIPNKTIQRPISGSITTGIPGGDHDNTIDPASQRSGSGGSLSGSGKAGVAIGVLIATIAVVVALHRLTRFYRAKKTKTFFMRSSMLGPRSRNDSAFSWHNGGAGDKDGHHLNINNEKMGDHYLQQSNAHVHPDSYTPDAMSPSSGDALNSTFSPLGSGPITASGRGGAGAGIGSDFRGSTWMEHLGLGKPAASSSSSYNFGGGNGRDSSNGLHNEMFPARHSSVDEGIGGVRISVVAPSIGSSQAAVLGRQNGHSRASSTLSGNHLHPLLFIKTHIPSPTLNGGSSSPRSPISKAFGSWRKDHSSSKNNDRQSKSSASSATATTPAVTSSEHSPTMLRNMVNSFPMPIITNDTIGTKDTQQHHMTGTRISATAPSSPHSPKRFASNNPFRNSVGASTVLTRAYSPFMRHSQAAFSEDDNKNPFEFEFESNGLDLDFTQLAAGAGGRESGTGTATRVDAPTARSSGLTPQASSGHTTINPTTPVTPATNKRNSASSVSIYSVEQSQQPFHPSNPSAQVSLSPSTTNTGAHTRIASARDSMNEDLIVYEQQSQKDANTSGNNNYDTHSNTGENQQDQQVWAPLDFKMSRESSRKPSFSSGFDESAWADELEAADPSPHTPKTFSKILDMYAGRAL